MALINLEKLLIASWWQFNMEQRNKFSVYYGSLLTFVRASSLTLSTVIRIFCMYTCTYLYGTPRVFSGKAPSNCLEKKNSLFTGFLQVFKKFVKHVPEPAFLLSVINFPKRKLSSDPKFRKWKKKRLVKVKLEKKVIWYNHNNRIETCPSLRKDFFTKIPRRYCFHVRMCCNVALKLQNQTCFY